MVVRPFSMLNAVSPQGVVDWRVLIADVGAGVGLISAKYHLNPANICKMIALSLCP